jgi:hypothetical protein
MEAVHVTPTRNLPSIMANGIHRVPPVLYQYDDVMARDYGSEYDPKKGLVFSFTLDDHEEKWFQHFVYWKVWGNPRNLAIGPICNAGNWDRLKETGPSAFSQIIPEQEHLTALVIDIPDHHLYGWYHHCQSHDMAPHWNDMQEKHEHNDKPLVLINYDVPPSCIKYQIGTAETALSKAGKIDIMMSMKKRKLYE